MAYPKQQVGRPAPLRAANAGATAVPVGVRPATIMPGQPGAMSPEQGVFVRLPGSNFAPAGSTPVDEMGDANIGAAATQLFLTVNVPDGQRFTMADIGFTADDETSLQFLSWTIFVGPNPLPGYINKSAVIGTLSQLGILGRVVQASQPVTIIGAVSANVGTHLGVGIVYHYFCRVYGWFYAEQEAV